MAYKLNILVKEQRVLYNSSSIQEVIDIVRKDIRSRIEKENMKSRI